MSWVSDAEGCEDENRAVSCAWVPPEERPTAFHTWPDEVGKGAKEQKAASPSKLLPWTSFFKRLDSGRDFLQTSSGKAL